jgi:hypothetical protein
MEVRCPRKGVDERGHGIQLLSASGFDNGFVKTQHRKEVHGIPNAGKRIAGVQFDGAPKASLRARPVPVLLHAPGQNRMRFGECIVQLESLFAPLPGRAFFGPLAFSSS